MRQKRSLAALLAGACTLLAPPGLLAQVTIPGVSVTTFHNDNARLGWNAQETRLTPRTVRPKTFGKRWQNPLDGEVFGSPLLVAGQTIRGRTTDVVYAATDHNSVYALDAQNGHVLWARRMLTRPLTDGEYRGNWHGRRPHGILSTPVIDSVSGTLYACGVQSKGLRQAYELWALDIHTGATRPGWPAEVRGSDGGRTFVAGEVLQRGALSLVNGRVYIAFGGRGDNPPWRGWVIGLDSTDPAAPTQAFCSSPKADGAGIWSGGGVSADAGGALYAVTGNGDPDTARETHSYAQSVVRLTSDGKALGCSHEARDYYTPSNSLFLNQQDEDLGGATADVLPDLPDSSAPHLLFTGGKDGLAYLLNRDNLGGVGGEIQKMRLFCDPKDTYHEGIRATSAYFDAGLHGRFLYVAGDNPGPSIPAGLVALKLDTDALRAPRFKRAWAMKKPLGLPSSPAVSSNGAADGIVWVVETEAADHSALHAFGALNGQELYNSTTAGPADQLDNGQRFTSPIIANGRVFVGAEGVVCYGLKGAGGKK